MTDTSATLSSAHCVSVQQGHSHDCIIKLIHCPQTASTHCCTRVMKELLQVISEANQAHSDAFEDLVIVRERALSVASAEAPRCQICLNAQEIIR